LLVVLCSVHVFLVSVTILYIFITCQHSSAEMQLLIQQFCPSICLSRSSVASKWLNMSSYFCQHMVASSFLSTKHHCKIVTGTPPMAALNTGEVYKFQNFSPLSGYMWQTIQDRPCLLWNGNRKSYMLCHTVTFLMTLSDL